jgi:hypothetical protein
MKLLALALALGVAAAPSGEAAESTSPAQALVLKPKAALAATPHSHRNAPFMHPSSSDLELELLPRRDQRAESSYYSCTGESQLCYDPASGRIIFKPGRALMPEIPGFKREKLSVKRDRIVFHYSF